MGNKIYNNERLRNIAGSVNGEALSDKRLLNNDYLRMIEEGINSLTPGSGGYRDGGSISAGGLTSSLLTGDNVGTIYNVSGEIAVTSANQALFVDATAGETFPEGTNVRVVERDGSYLFDVFAGFVGIPDVTADPTGAADSGLMSSADKAKLDGIETDANAYVLPAATTEALGGVKPGTGLKVEDGTLSVNTTASGDGSQAGPILSLSAKGWAEQSTTTGKNLLPRYNVDVKTANGITFTVNADGSITANGTATANADISLVSSIAGLFPAGTYTFSGGADGGSDSTYKMQLGINGYPNNDGSLYSSTDTKTLTLGEGDNFQWRIRIYSGTTVNNLTFYPQLELGSTATSYEPYTGGAPSPSPDYAQEIRVCKGRNLLDAASPTKLYNNSGAIATSDSATSYIAKVERNTDYTASCVGGNRSTVVGCGSAYPTVGGSCTSITAATSYSAPFTINSGENDYLIVQFGGNAVSVSEPQLELGSVATPYVPYGYVGMETQGKNLWHQTVVADGDSVTSNGVTMTACDNGSGFLASGTATANAYYPSAMGSADERLYSLLSAGTYTASSNTAFRIRKLVNGTVEDIKGATTGSWTFVLDEDTLVRIIPIVLSGTVLSTPTYMWAQIEKGSTATPYQPYYNTTTHIPLPSRGWVASLPDGTADTLTLDGAGKATWGKACEEVTFDGSSGEGWYTSSTANIYYIKLDNVTSSSPVRSTNTKCNHFTVTTNTGANMLHGEYMFQTNSSGRYIYFKHTGCVDLAAFKTWLASNPVTVLYPLATPVTEDCGYVDLPEIPEGATVSIPELDDLGVKYCVDVAASELARMWYGKMRYEHDLDVVSINGTIDEIEDGVVELAGQVVTHEGRLSSVEGRLDAMQSLVRGADGYYVNESVTAFLAANFDGKLYGYSEPKTTAVDVTKTGANAGLANPTLGTATTSGSSAYRHRGPFQWHAAKGHVDADGVPHVRVIRGVDTDEDWEACDENVWSLRPVVWYKMDSSGTAVLGQVSDTWHYGLEPNPQAYLPDGTLRPYMLAPRYALGFEDGVGVSKSGLKGYGRDVSHNSLIEQLDYANSGYSGKTIYELWYDAFMSRMIYGTKDFQTVMQGCTQYNLQYNPTVAETGVKRVILSNANAANLVVGSTMMLGNQSTANTDRNNVNAYNVFDGLVIESITTYDANNKAVNFVTDTTFDTATTYLLSTAPWHSGSCDAMDWDGSPTDPQSAKEVAFFQGCEILHGATEVLAGVILKGQANERQVPYVTYDTRDDATSITSDFIKCGDGLLSNTGSSNAWKYPLYLADHGGLVYGEGTGGSTTTGLTDGQYVRPDSNATDSEWRSSGSLGGGRVGGPACVGGGGGVSGAWWSIWSRLSGAGRSRG